MATSGQSIVVRAATRDCARNYAFGGSSSSSSTCPGRTCPRTVLPTSLQWSRGFSSFANGAPPLGVSLGAEARGRLLSVWPPQGPARRAKHHSHGARTSDVNLCQRALWNCGAALQPNTPLARSTQRSQLTPQQRRGFMMIRESDEKDGAQKQTTMRTIRSVMRYAWPRGDRKLQARLVGSMACLVRGRSKASCAPASSSLFASGRAGWRTALVAVGLDCFETGLVLHLRRSTLPRCAWCVKRCIRSIEPI